MTDHLFLPTARQTNVLLIVGFLALGYALYLRYLVIEQSTVGLPCEAGLDTWLCLTRSATIALFTHTVFGVVGLGAAVLHFIRPSLVLFVIALVAAAFGIVLYNVATSSLAVALLILSFARPQPAA
jgi:predicted neutral ceramidase superfamily lipid hydrolase